MKLKNYFQFGIGAGLVLALAAGIAYYRSDAGDAQAAAPEEVIDSMEAGPDIRLEEDIAAKTAAQNGSSKEVTSPEPEKVDLNKASHFFAQSMKHLAACIRISLDSGDQLEPTTENLLKTVKPIFGDPILNSIDTVVWSLRASGEERRIRIETDYSDSSGNTRNLRYLKIDDKGVLSLIPLPTEQTQNPSEAFIASLQKDGTVYQEEKSLRAYFERGQEMTVTEKDGNVDGYEVTNGPKTFRCAGVLTASASCKCQ